MPQRNNSPALDSKLHKAENQMMIFLANLHVPGALVAMHIWT